MLYLKHFDPTVLFFCAGVVGTHRFCSSRDLGDQCQDIWFPDHDRMYRACVYSCSSDGCNGAIKLSTFFTLLVGCVSTVVAVVRHLWSVGDELFWQLVANVCERRVTGILKWFNILKPYIWIWYFSMCWNYFFSLFCVLMLFNTIVNLKLLWYF